MAWEVWTIVKGELQGVFETQAEALSAADTELKSSEFYEFDKDFNEWETIEDAIGGGYVKTIEVDEG